MAFFRDGLDAERWSALPEEVITLLVEDERMWVFIIITIMVGSISLNILSIDNLNKPQRDIQDLI